jgi:hypothetical protein
MRSTQLSTRLAAEELESNSKVSIPRGNINKCPVHNLGFRSDGARISITDNLGLICSVVSKLHAAVDFRSQILYLGRDSSVIVRL